MVQVFNLNFNSRRQCIKSPILISLLMSHSVVPNLRHREPFFHVYHKLGRLARLGLVQKIVLYEIYRLRIQVVRIVTAPGVNIKPYHFCKSHSRPVFCQKFPDDVSRRLCCNVESSIIRKSREEVFVLKCKL